MVLKYYHPLIEPYHLNPFKLFSLIQLLVQQKDRLILELQLLFKVFLLPYQHVFQVLDQCSYEIQLIVDLI